MKKGVLLVNLGTPDSPSTKDVRKFLREFLLDPLVVDLPALSRWLLVNLIIAPFRAPKSAQEYQLLWTKRGSPLKFHSHDLLAKIKTALPQELAIEMAMRYQNPSIAVGLESLRTQGCDQILVVPLFPQYAEATNLSVINEVKRQLQVMDWSVDAEFTDSFPEHKGYIEAIVAAAELQDQPFDHTLFSFHSLPERQLKKLNSSCLSNDCCAELSASNENCYRAQCFATARAIAKQLDLTPEQYTVSFQSRQGRIPWVQPYTDEVVQQLADSGTQRLCVFSPAFVADCLETNIELGHTYKELFLAHGGKSFYLAPCVNSHDLWVKALSDIILNDDIVHRT